jgi:hypothetical protein
VPWFFRGRARDHAIQNPTSAAKIRRLGELVGLGALRRRRSEIADEYGREAYELAEASLQWRAYQFLGKLRPTVYLLAR